MNLVNLQILKHFIARRSALRAVVSTSLIVFSASFEVAKETLPLTCTNDNQSAMICFFLTFAV